jgi:hypothetical protein
MKALRILQFSFSLVLVFCVVTFASGSVTSSSYIPEGNYESSSAYDSHTEYAYIQAGTQFSWQLEVMAYVLTGFASAQASIGSPVNSTLVKTGVNNRIPEYKSGSTTQTSSTTIQLYTSVSIYMGYGSAHAYSSVYW